MEKLILYTISHAGASAMLYKRYQKLLNPDIGLYLLERPGIGIRTGENLINDFSGVLDDLRRLLSSHQRHMLPYAIFGHSMGVLLAYELSRDCDSDPMFQHVFLSACTPPNHHCASRKISDMDDAGLMKTVCRIGHMNLEEMERLENSQIFLPIFRADFQAFDSYHHIERSALSVNATVLYGQNDNYVKSSRIKDWNECFQNEPEYVMISGDHMFHVNSYMSVVSAIRRTLQP
jgi:surfactin synthase thioesterase subunit